MVRKSFDFEHAPGHLIRRAHQIAVAAFMQETARHEATPVQFAILNALIDQPGEDQKTLAAHVAFDAATIGSVIARLEARGWLVRQADAADARRKLLRITPAGRRAAQKMAQEVARAQEVILAPLDNAERVNLLRLLTKLVQER